MNFNNWMMCNLFCGSRYSTTIDGAVNKRHLIAISEGTVVDGVSCIPEELLPQQPDKSRPRLCIMVSPTSISTDKCSNLIHYWRVHKCSRTFLVILNMLNQLPVNSWGEKSWSTRACQKCWTSGILLILDLCTHHPHQNGYIVDVNLFCFISFQIY